MERTPEHLDEDPSLRKSIVDQVSLDEFLAARAPVLLLPNAREIVEAGLAAKGVDRTFEEVVKLITDEWLDSLDADTQMNEVLYLQGHVSRINRLAASDQLQSLIDGYKADSDQPDKVESDVDFASRYGIDLN